jgi:hypothetical protein
VEAETEFSEPFPVLTADRFTAPIEERLVRVLGLSTAKEKESEYRKFFHGLAVDFRSWLRTTPGAKRILHAAEKGDTVYLFSEKQWKEWMAKAEQHRS